MKTKLTSAVPKGRRELYSGGPNIGSTTARWTYDAFGRLKSIPGLITTQTYEADGQTESITYANGVTTSFTYDMKRRWVKQIQLKNAACTSLSNTVYARDPKVGRINAINGNLAQDDRTYTYDDLDRLLIATNASDTTRTETFTYALNDNMLSRTRMNGTRRLPMRSTRWQTHAFLHAHEWHLFLSGGYRRSPPCPTQRRQPRFHL